jgi:hypothetical protein
MKIFLAIIVAAVTLGSCDSWSSVPKGKPVAGKSQGSMVAQNVTIEKQLVGKINEYVVQVKVAMANKNEKELEKLNAQRVQIVESALQLIKMTGQFKMYQKIIPDNCNGGTTWKACEPKLELFGRAMDGYLKLQH